MPRRRASSTPARGEAAIDAGDAGSLQGESLVALNRRWPRRPRGGSRPKAPIARRGGRRDRRGHRQHAGAAPGAGHARGRISGQAHADEARPSRDAQPALADRRARPPDRAAKPSQVVGGRSNTPAGRISRPRWRPSARCRARVAALKGSVLDLRGRSIQYNILQREVDTNRGLYDALLQRYKEIGVAGGVGTDAGVDRRSRRGAGRAVQAQPAAQPAGRAWRSACSPASARAVALEFLNDTIKTPRGRPQQARPGLPRRRSPSAAARARSSRI